MATSGREGELGFEDRSGRRRIVTLACAGVLLAALGFGACGGASLPSVPLFPVGFPQPAGDRDRAGRHDHPRPGLRDHDADGRRDLGDGTDLQRAHPGAHLPDEARCDGLPRERGQPLPAEPGGATGRCLPARSLHDQPPYPWTDGRPERHQRQRPSPDGAGDDERGPRGIAP